MFCSQRYQLRHWRAFCYGVNHTAIGVFNILIERPVLVGWEGAKSMKLKLVVIGNGMAPGRMLENLFERAPDAYDVTIFNSEPRVNYDRIMLSPVLAGEKTFDQIVIHGDRWYHKHGITLHKGATITAIDRSKKTVTSARGLTVAYDKLLIATGSLPIVIPVPGHTLAGVLSYRDLDDVQAMLLAAQARGKAVVIGGGLLGLEAAAGLRERGMDVTVLHLMSTLMERQLDAEAGQLLRSAVEGRGIKVITQAQTQAILGEKKVEAVLLADGTRLPADLVIMAVGIKPNSQLAKAAGLETGRGIKVDAAMQTTDPDIFAVGECAEVAGEVFGLVAPLYEMAHVIAGQLSGDTTARFQRSALATRLKVTGIDLFSAGDFATADDRSDVVVSDPARGVYKRLVFKEERLLGAVLYGDTRDGARLFKVIERGGAFSGNRDALMFGFDVGMAA
jgi:nitrite reductase (NADH) large subunit